VYVDQALGDPGVQNANSLLQAADAVVAQNNDIFGIDGAPVSVVIYAMGGATDGSGGADHGGCDFTVGNAIEVDASFGSPNRIIGLFEAELSECAMNCGMAFVSWLLSQGKNLGQVAKAMVGLGDAGTLAQL
jgi:hypothetical protein